jgi:signal transduction histidine kinase
MRRLARLLTALEALGGDLGGEPGDGGGGPDAVLERTADAATELTGARHALLAVLAEDGERVGRLVVRGLPGGAAHPAARDLTRALTVPGERPGPPPGALRVPLRVHGARFGALQVGGGGPFGDDERRLLAALAAGAGLALGSARLREAVRRRDRWMDGSLELTVALLTTDEDNALAVVAEQATRLADAAAGAVLEPAGDGGDLRVTAFSTPGGRRRAAGTAVPGTSPAVRRVMAGEPVVLDDPAADPRLVTGLLERQGPTLLLPLAGDGAALGALVLCRAPGARPYSVPERALATQFAQQAALALLLARARRDRERLAVLADRDRIARDLHDLVIQRLFAVGMVLEGARRAAPGTEAADRVETAVRELDATVQEIRTAIFALQQPPDEAPAGLRTRVLRETGAAARLLGFPPSVTFTGPVDALVGESVAAHLVAALREGLSNAARHARASRVEVVVDATARLPDGRDAVRLTVADDGTGVPADVTRRSGLRNLARRAESLGGSAGTGPGLAGRGTTLTWQAPR